MSASGSFSTKSPTLRRILREASELSTSPCPDFAAAPLETNLFEWHFTLRGPPAPSPFATGLYHGRIVLPPSYPLRPPSFRFLTPSGRFEVNREICLSISGFHEETWQPAWGIRTALTAIRAFMDGSSAGQIGGLEAADEVRTRLAGESAKWKCAACGGRSNEEVMREQEKICEELPVAEGDDRLEKVPEELILGYRDEMGHEGGTAQGSGGRAGETATVEAAVPVPVVASGAISNVERSELEEESTTAPLMEQQNGPRYRVPRNVPLSMPVRASQRSVPSQTTAAAVPPQQLVPQQSHTPWLDKAIQIVGVALALAIARLLLR